MFSFGVPQILIPVYVAMAAVVPPALRWLIMNFGKKPVSWEPWGRFWFNWSVGSAVRGCMLVLLYFGGFWR